MYQKKLFAAAIIFTGIMLSVMNAEAGQPLETETARTLPAGAFEIDFTGEYQFSSEGKEIAVPLAIEYGIIDNLSLLVEPVPYTAILPSEGKSAKGIGDLEITATWRFFRETMYLPDMAVAGEVKVPTARNYQIGTKKTDYTGYYTVSKKFGPVDVHLMAGYSIMGKVPGLQIKNTFDYGAAFEYFINEKFDLVGEVVGNTAAASEAEAESASAVTSEVAGAETVGMLGFRWHYTKNQAFCFGVTYDNNKAVMLRPGITIYF